MQEAIIAGFISGLLSPLFLSILQQKLVWKPQKQFEIKFGVLTDAIKALSAYQSDALNPELQKTKEEYKGMVRKINARPETDQLMDNSRSMVKAFFSDKSYKAFDHALRTNVSLENMPNMEYEENRISAIIQIASELRITDRNIWQAITSKFT